MQHEAKFQRLDGAMLAFGLMGLGADLAVQLLVAPRFMMMFADFGGELPVATRMAVSPAFTWTPLLLIALLAGGGAALTASGQRAYGRAASVSSIVIALLSIAFTMVALYLPIFALAGAIQP